MLRALLFGCFVFLFSPAFAQDVTELYEAVEVAKNELGINVFSLDAIKENKPVFCTGIAYKHHWDKHSLRLTFDYYHRKTEVYDGDPSLFWLSDTGVCRRWDVRAGYQYSFLSNKYVKPYAGCDVTVFHTRWVGTQNGYSDFPPYNIHEKYDSKQVNAGLAPVVGIAFFPFNWLSVSVEVNAGFTYYSNNRLNDSGGFDTQFNFLRSFTICARF